MDEKNVSGLGFWIWDNLRSLFCGFRVKVRDQLELVAQANSIIFKKVLVHFWELDELLEKSECAISIVVCDQDCLALRIVAKSDLSPMTLSSIHLVSGFGDSFRKVTFSVVLQDGCPEPAHACRRHDAVPWKVDLDRRFQPGM